MRTADLDVWALGVMSFLYAVLTLGDPATGRRDFPPSAAGWVWLAVRRIRRRALPCDERVVKFAEKWLRSVGGFPAMRPRRMRRGAAKR